jgi:ABC-type proline/glycine betaine transport system permease subunit
LRSTYFWEAAGFLDVFQIVSPPPSIVKNFYLFIKTKTKTTDLLNKMPPKQNLTGPRCGKSIRVFVSSVFWSPIPPPTLTEIGICVWIIYIYKKMAAICFLFCCSRCHTWKRLIFYFFIFLSCSVISLVIGTFFFIIIIIIQKKRIHTSYSYS